jgi:hypothetical protein
MSDLNTKDDLERALKVKGEAETNALITDREERIANIQTRVETKKDPQDRDIPEENIANLTAIIGFYTEEIGLAKKLLEEYQPKSGGKGTRRKRHSGKKWTSSGTRKRSSMSASKARRARK